MLANVTVNWETKPTAIPNAALYTSFLVRVVDAAGNFVALANEPLTSLTHVFVDLNLVPEATYSVSLVLQQDGGVLDTNVATATFVVPAAALAPVPFNITVAIIGK